ncbi:MAG: AI-2E family transporter, partial [Chloroflexi bacterium]
TRGLAILLLAVGVLSTIAFVSIGLPNALLLGIAAGLLEIVPLIGPALGAIPALLVAASTDPTKVIWVLGAYILIQFAESHFLVPRVMDRTVGVNPVASLLAFVAFGSIFGFAGAILAVPLAAVIQLILNHFVFEANPIDQVPLTGRSGLSTLRYEAQDLVQDIRKQIRGKEAEVTAREDRIEDAMEAIAQDLDSILAQSEIDHESDRI